MRSLPARSPVPSSRCAWVVLLLGAASARANLPAFFDPPAQRKVLVAFRLARPPVLDGALDDEAWQRPAGARGFVQSEPRQGEPSTNQSEVWVAFDDEAVYVAARLAQPGGFAAFNQRDLRRDWAATDCDSFSVILDTLGDGRNAFTFSVNPFGAQRDTQVVDDSSTELNWDTLWRARTRRDDRGWTLELAIPWKSLRHGGPGVPWGVQFSRRERGRNEDTVWSPIPRTVSAARMTYAGVLEGLEPPAPSLLAVQARPYAVGRFERVEGQPAALAPGIGGEVTWTPTPSTTVDLTANTDFAETDVDRRVVNLSRFSVFFPERRQFFLESAGVFASGRAAVVQPFFSRRIGLDDGQPVPIAAGARAVYRSTSRSAGALVAHTLGTASVAPAAFGVARYGHNLGAQSRVGGTLVVRHDFAHAGALERTNLVPAVDGLFRAGPVTVTSTLMGSSTARPGEAAQLGLAGVADVRLQGNWGYLTANAQAVTRGFDARAGFVARGDVLGLGASAGIDHRPAWLPSWLRTAGPFVDTYALWSASTQRFQEWSVYLAPMWLLFSGGDELWLFVQKDQQVLTSTFAPVRDVAFGPGDYGFERIGLSGFSQASRKLSLGAEASVGGYYTAAQFAGLLRASVQPIPHVQVAATYTYNRFWGPGVLADFAQTHLLLLEARLALTPQLQLIGSYQRDTDGNQSVLNARLAWEFLPLSFVYVVLTDTRAVVPSREDAPVGDLRVVAKVTYTWRP